MLKIEFIQKMLKNQSGIVFGMEARIALVVLSIVGMAISINQLSLNESKRIETNRDMMIELQLKFIMYNKNETNADLTVFNTIYDQNETFFINPVFSAMNSLHLKQDAWGNNWVFKVFQADSNTMMAFGEPIAPYCIVIFSAGADRHHYLSGQYTAASYDDCINNVGLSDVAIDTTVSDDYFYKFTTIETDIEINGIVNERLQIIRDALVNYAEATQNVRIAYCDGLTQVVANADALCDLDSNGTYTQQELLDANFYPKSTSDASGAVYAESTSDDYDFFSLIGLPIIYIVDPLGRELIYNSNTTNVTEPPYYISVKYEEYEE